MRYIMCPPVSHEKDEATFAWDGAATGSFHARRQYRSDLPEIESNIASSGIGYHFQPSAETTSPRGVAKFQDPNCPLFTATAWQGMYVAWPNQLQDLGVVCVRHSDTRIQTDTTTLHVVYAAAWCFA